jgi:hypothetical protein
MTYVVVSAISGILFGVLDAAINVNPAGRRLLKPYAPIMKTSVNPVAGILIDLVYGFIMAGLFLILYESLPGSSGLLKGVSFALMAWFFRVVMAAASQWMMFRVPARTVFYGVATGLGEMLVLGLFYGWTLEPAT